MESHLLQMRGLKRENVKKDRIKRQSHLLQMRGLKHRDAAVFKLQQESHLLQMRGLKRVLKIYLRSNHLVASFTDAWIETRQCWRSRLYY